MTVAKLRDLARFVQSCTENTRNTGTIIIALPLQTRVHPWITCLLFRPLLLSGHRTVDRLMHGATHQPIRRVFVGSYARDDLSETGKHASPMEGLGHGPTLVSRRNSMGIPVPTRRWAVDLRRKHPASVSPDRGQNRSPSPAPRAEPPLPRPAPGSSPAPSPRWKRFARSLRIQICDPDERINFEPVEAAPVVHRVRVGRRVRWEHGAPVGRGWDVVTWMRKRPEQILNTELR